MSKMICTPLNKDIDYYLTNDSFNENGITPGDVIFAAGKKGAVKE